LPTNSPSSSPTEEDIDLTIPEPGTASFPPIQDESSLPDGYFNYNMEDKKYGPKAWDNIDTSNNRWKAFFADTSADLLVEGRGIEDDAKINGCNTGLARQAPINVGDDFKSDCDEYHQFRNRVSRVYVLSFHLGISRSINRSEYQYLTLCLLLSIISKNGRFDRLTREDRVTVSVLPNMLRVDFDRSGVEGKEKHLLLPNFPMSDGPNYLQPINAVNVQVTVSSILWLVVSMTL
jgi:hypothetical protein